MTTELKISPKISRQAAVSSTASESLPEPLVKRRKKAFSQNQIKLCRAFFQENVIFEPCAQIKFSTLYSCYCSVLKERDFECYVVPTRDFWSLLVDSVPNLKDRVRKKTQKSLICYGLELKQNILTEEVIREKFPTFQEDFFG